MVLAHVADATGRPIEDVLGDLNMASGLAGLCGSSDMRVVVARAGNGDEAAALALDVYSHRVKKYLGAYMAVLGGCDGIVFTAGIGEHGPQVRAAACSGLERLGVVIDPERNARNAATISTDDSPIAVLVVPTDEEHAIAVHTAELAAEIIG
jgi:acetate kinase